ncbi:MAG: formate dehydrogenase, partial [Prosthecobacter sp.]
MSKNLSALSFRKGIEKNVFERMVDAAEKHGTAEKHDLVRQMGQDHLFGDAITLGAVSFYDFMKKENEGKKVFVCNGSACLCAGTQDKLHHSLESHFKKEEIGHICCLGRCHEGGALQFGGKNYSGQSEAALSDLFKTGSGDSEDRYAVVSHLQPAILTAEFQGIEDYYAPFKKLITEGNRDALGAELKDSGLRGRGGAGFPLSIKWAGCRAAEGKVKYVVCNADEGDPGAYIDKYLMEKRPHSVLLGMMVAGWYAGAETGVLYIRAEYPDSVTIVNQAIADLHADGLVGRISLGPGFNFALKKINGAGAYIW